MTYEEFEAKFRGRLLVILTEAWAVRKMAPSDVGMFMDKHYIEIRQALRDIYNSLVPAKPAPTPPPNGPMPPKSPTPKGAPPR